MSVVAKNIVQLNRALSGKAKLIAVSKTKPIQSIQEAYDAGQRIFGENKVQEMTEKYEQLPKDIQWHMIGHLQSNKVKYMASFVSLIHGVDSLSLLKEIQKQAKKVNRVQDVLLQFHIAQEETKFGFSQEEAEALLQSADFKAMDAVRIVGVMGMASFTDNKEQIRAEFKELNFIFSFLKKTYFSQADYFNEISAGMSGDYQIALEEGSTMVRIGSTIFGERVYPV